MEAIGAAFMTAFVAFIIHWSKFQKLRATIKEVKDVITAVVNAYEDDQVSEEEFSLIIKELKDVSISAKKLFK